MALIVLLFMFSVYGAFIGAERAGAFFNTAPLGVYWALFVAMLLAGIALFRRLIKAPALLLTHLGCVLVFAGGMWGSDAGGELRKNLFGTDKLRTGQMFIYEGASENRAVPKGLEVRMGFDEQGNLMFDDESGLYKLDFEIRLKDFRVEYYDPPHLQVEDIADRGWRIEPVAAGEVFDLTDNTSVEIVEVFENLQVVRGGAEDRPGLGLNPAVRLVVRNADEAEERYLVFAKFPGFMAEEGDFKFRYVTEGMVKDYFSDLEVVEAGRVVKSGTIQVNEPLYYKGYHFYQDDYDHEQQRYTVLGVTSDSGLYCVYAGYWMLSLGIVWHMWISPVLRRKRSEKRA